MVEMEWDEKQIIQINIYCFVLEGLRVIDGEFNNTPANNHSIPVTFRFKSLYIPELKYLL